MPTFTVPGKPIGQPRHRSTRTGHHYIPSDHAIHGYKAALQLLNTQRRQLEGAVSVNMTCYLPRPKKIDKQLPEGACWAYCVKPDIDNLEKAVFDALNTLAYLDDQQICEVHARKLFVPRGTEPKTIITIEPGGSV